ncbi:MAG TPA: adenosylmethionine decarboxylase [Anaerolineales bacterium]|nr:adenosylmethionine decarboxylase [Anaerolineales bacterium]HQX16926.1 adenosylmethionine decarboxylase [Anaerolineales bacterium]
MRNTFYTPEVYVNATLKLGEHFIFDLSDCNREILMDSEYSYSLFAQAIRASGLTVVDEGFYKFSPHGFTCFLLLAESHASLHAWPEYGYCAIDLFTCAIGKDMTPLLMRIKEAFGADDFSMRKLDREASIETQLPIAV